MKTTKKIKLVLLSALCLLLFLPTASFALVDVNLYGGIPFEGERGHVNKNLALFDDHSFGVSAHLNKDFLVFLQFGFGAFYQVSATTYRYNGKNHTYDNYSAGLDAYIQLDFPLIPIAPYIRGSEAAWHKTKVSGQSKVENFKRHSIGGGLLFSLLSLPEVLTLQLFGEYMYSFGKEFGDNFKEHQINIGARFAIF